MCIYNCSNMFFYRKLVLFWELNYKKQTQNVFSFYDSLALDRTWTWKHSRYLTWLGLTLWFWLEIYSDLFADFELILWYIEVGLRNYTEYLTGFELTCWYTGLRLEKCLDYLTGLGLLLLYIWLGLIKLINQPGMPPVKQLVIQTSPIFLG